METTKYYMHACKERLWMIITMRRQNIKNKTYEPCLVTKRFKGNKK